MKELIKKWLGIAENKKSIDLTKEELDLLEKRVLEIERGLPKVIKKLQDEVQELALTVNAKKSEIQVLSKQVELIKDVVYPTSIKIDPTPTPKKAAPKKSAKKTPPKKVTKK